MRWRVIGATPDPSSAAGAGEGLAEDQSGSVVERLVRGGFARLAAVGAAGAVLAGAGGCLVADQAGEAAAEMKIVVVLALISLSFL